MPIIPQYSPQVEIQTPPPGPRLNPAAAAAQAGAPFEALAEVTTHLGDVFQKIHEANQATDLTNAQTALITGKANLQGQLEQEPDPKVIQSKWVTGMNALQAQIGGTITDPAVRKAFDTTFARTLAGDQISVVRLAAARTSEAGKAAWLSSSQQLATAAANAPNELVRQQIVGQATSQLAGMIAAGTIHADQGEHLRQEFASRVDQAHVLGLINASPSAALHALADPAQLTNLDPVARERLFSTATTAVNSATVKAEAAQRRALVNGKLWADQQLNDLYVQQANAAQGTGDPVTIAQVAKLRDFLSPGETAAILHSISATGAQRDDPGAVADLQPQIDRLDPDAFNAQATQYLQAGRLKPDTYRAMVNANRGARKDDAPASAFRSGRSFVSDALDPGNVVGGQFMRGPLATARGNALADYDTWATGNATASREDAIAKARDLVTRYQVGADAESKISLPRPFGFQGPRDQVDPAAIQRAAAAAAAAAKAGTLAGAELLRERDVLNAWQTILQREALSRQTGTPPRPGTRGGGANTRIAP